jgi:hypothetical protein
MPAIRNRQLDGRTRLAKRAKQIEKSLVADLGGTLSDAKTAAIRRAAELFVICEHARARWMAGDPSPTASELATLDNALKRALEYLGLSAKDVAAKAPEDFSDEMMRLAIPQGDEDEEAT